MALEFQTLADVRAHGFDDVIDVRSPAEFAEDHIPGALSLPVLSNDERAHVGTIYVQDSAFKARKIGAALVARNAAHHIETALADRDGGWRPLVYCWRGGQRSGSFASILSQIGWPPPAYAAGWKDMVHVEEGWSEVLVRFDYEATKDAPYMYHCHILEHEDCGMMGQFTVT